MKPYFAEWVTVKGEIKELDYYIHASYPKALFRHYEPWDWKKVEAQKVKLMLCIKDIKVGSKVHWLNSPLFWIVKEINHKEEWLSVEDDNEKYYIGDFISQDYKVIGEISPKATWVKKGDEFDKEDWKEERGIFDTLYILIKCSNCGTFH